MKKVLVCGGRGYINKARLEEVLNSRSDIGCIVQGGATGADRLAKLWAISKGIPEFECKANWTKFQKAAGSIRNNWMLQWFKPDLVIAFPAPESRGTWHMIKLARETPGVEVLVIE